MRDTCVPPTSHKLAVAVQKSTLFCRALLLYANVLLETHFQLWVLFSLVSYSHTNNVCVCNNIMTDNNIF